MFEKFDFRVLDSPEFKEDSVREEIIAPILHRLGYQPSGSIRLVRSKPLVHPFVRIGTRKHQVNIVPDYTVCRGDKALLVLEAKAPSEPIVGSHHVEQAYSYAIHPEVRARHFALCNGRQLVMYDVDEFDPVLDIAAQDFDVRWPMLERYLSPASLEEPARRRFQPDLGSVVARLGLTSDADIIFPNCRLQLIGRVDDTLYTASSACDMVEGQLHLASFDFPPVVLRQLLSCLAEPLAVQVASALSRQPFQAYVDFMIEVDWRTRLGEVVPGQHDRFIPFLVQEVLAARFNRTAGPGEIGDVPPQIFRLRAAFELLQG